MNYGEELAYWYLRLNGFFPLSNFVVHKSSHVTYTSDCDLVAVRHPNVYEEIGGKDDDWDDVLCSRLDFNRTIGLICEVKTGGYDRTKLFKTANVRYAIGRLGIVPINRIEEISHQLMNSSTIDISDDLQISKLLVGNLDERPADYICVNLRSVRKFLRERVKKYPIEKFRDRMFFGSILFQELIDQTVLDDGGKTTGIPARRKQHR